MTREEKRMIEKRLQELEEQHFSQQEQLRREAEQRALVRTVKILKIWTPSIHSCPRNRTVLFYNVELRPKDAD